MTTYEKDAWDEFGDSGNGIEGQWLKCSKGHWTLDKEDVETGDDGIKICVIMDSVTLGQVLWQDSKIIGRNIGRLSDGFVPPMKKADLTPGWDPYIAFQAVRADDEHLGDLITFTSNSWGGFYAFQALVNPFRLKGRQQFPICVLKTKDRGDANGTVDPVFKIMSWSIRENFTELLPAPTAPAALPSPLPAPKVSKATADLDDSIPF